MDLQYPYRKGGENHERMKKAIMQLETHYGFLFGVLSN
jgi:hypothetical protein